MVAEHRQVANIAARGAITCHQPSNLALRPAPISPYRGPDYWAACRPGGGNFRSGAVSSGPHRHDTWSWAHGSTVHSRASTVGDGAWWAPGCGRDDRTSAPTEIVAVYPPDRSANRFLSAAIASHAGAGLLALGSRQAADRARRFPYAVSRRVPGKARRLSTLPAGWAARAAAPVNCHRTVENASTPCRTRPLGLERRVALPPRPNEFCHQDLKRWSHTCSRNFSQRRPLPPLP